METTKELLTSILNVDAEAILVACKLEDSNAPDEDVAIRRITI